MKIKIKYSTLLLILLFISGCSKKMDVSESPADFQFITVNNGDSFNSLAEQYTGSADLAWRIKEFNGIDQPIPGKQLIVPIKPFRHGGLTSEGYQLIPVLSYHNFSKGPSSKKLTVSARDFRAQLNYLKNNNYHVITMDQLVDFLDFGQVPEKSVLISIDDGWISSYKIAYPILKEFGFNATLFIPTNIIETGNSRSISWDQIKEMVSDNTIDIQCHSKSHRDLSTINFDESFAEYIKAIEQDILHSKQTIFNKLGKQVAALAYPFGNTNPLVIALIKKHGYKTAFTVNREGNPFYTQSFMLNRSMVYGTFNINRFAKDLQYFAKFKIAEPEPIDTLPSLATIASTNPKEYESSGQLRTALLAWKLHRDKLISQRQGDNSNNPDPDTELLLKQSIQEAKEKVSQLTIKLNDIAKQFYLDAIKNMHQKEAQKPLLKSLLYNPENKAPINLFQTNMGELRPFIYEVKEQDSYISIANQLYQDPEKSILVPIFNDNINDEKDLAQGMKLSLPAIPADIIIKASRIGPGCNITLSKPPEQMANDYYAKAIEHFNHDEISSAIENLETTLCIKPDHTQAQEMLEMLKDL